MERIESSVTGSVAGSVSESLPISFRGYVLNYVAIVTIAFPRPSMSPPPMPLVSPPIQSPLYSLGHPPASFSFSQSLAAEVKEATGELLDGLATPTTPNDSINAQDSTSFTNYGTTPTDIAIKHEITPNYSDTPTPTDTSRLLSDDDVVTSSATLNNNKYVSVKVEPGALTSPVTMETPPVSASTSIPQRNSLPRPPSPRPSSPMPTRMFKVIIISIMACTVFHIWCYVGCCAG